MLYGSCGRLELEQVDRGRCIRVPIRLVFCFWGSKELCVLFGKSVCDVRTRRICGQLSLPERLESEANHKFLFQK